MDPVLFGWSYDFVGDLAETVALIWPAKPRRERNARPRRGGRGAAASHRADLPRPARALARRAGRDRPLGAAEAGHRRPAHRRLRPARQEALAGLGELERRRDRGALARAGAALRGAVRLARGPRPSARRRATRAVPPAHAGARHRGAGFRQARPRRLSRPNGSGTASACRPSAAQRRADVARLYSRTGDDISRAFPDIVEAMDFDGALDGELLVAARAARVQSFADCSSG